MEHDISIFTSHYMMLCKAALAYAPLLTDPVADKSERKTAENNYYTALLACEQSARAAFPNIGGIGPVLARTLENAQITDLPLAEFKTNSLAVVMEDLAALPGRRVAAGQHASAVDAADKRAR